MAAQNIITQAGMTAIKTAISGLIKAARYRIDGTYYDADMEPGTITADGRLEIPMRLNPPRNGNVLISEVQLVGNDEAVLVQKAESIYLNADGGEIYYQFDFAVTEIQR